MFNLVVDEAQDFASSGLPWGELLAQGRKYGLSLTVANQNLEQLPKEFRETLLANARSKVVFALAAHDAKVMEKVFSPALTAADLMALDPFSVAALVALDSGGVSRPVTLGTPPPPEPEGTAAAVQAASRRRYAKARAVVEAELRQQVTDQRQAAAVPLGRKKRSQS